MFLQSYMMLKSHRIFSTKLMFYILILHMPIPALEYSSSNHSTIRFCPFHPYPSMTSKPWHRNREAIHNPELYQSDTVYHVDTVYQPTEKERNGGDFFSRPITDTEYLILLVCII
ncbi:hypothetical protein AVEN_242220-1 [Araneus ventricosus]|uniref:Uncharacterized protein n=1 Tax=Araneus ventricosus TaxID=182803 RepID=A0A4Y2FRG1_ARAVE|nr:hypothetical protein AVEN_242220-1 [Araneus ventricosus]